MPDQSADDPTPEPDRPAAASVSRRTLLASLAATAGVGGVGGALVARGFGTNPAPPAPAGGDQRSVQFHGTHQPGIATPQQRYAFFAAFDLETSGPAAGGPLPTDRIAANFRQLMERWTVVAERLMSTQPPGPPANSPDAPADTGIADGLLSSLLTLTFGLGPALFDQIGQQHLRPHRLHPLPAFPADRLEPTWSDGHLFVQICGNDPQVISHAFRAVRSRTPGLARLRWTQQGFLGAFGEETPRNLFGHKDGTANPRVGTTEFDDVVWVDGPEEPAWFAGGAYLVFRKIRMDLPKWDTSTIEEQNQSVGRRRDNGAPLSGGDEFTAPDFSRTGPDGKPVIPPDSHVALVHGIPMLRRPYNYDYAVHGVAKAMADAAHHGPGQADHSHDGPAHEHSGHEAYDSGVLFCAYLRDPAEFVRAQQKLDGSDRMSAFLRHTGSAIFAIPPGIQPGQHLGSALFA
jgi:deferrochelatase/peroxidase EfeB